jgi:hypothetical protein
MIKKSSHAIILVDCRQGVMKNLLHQHALSDISEEHILIHVGRHQG